jgi:uncharacterized damage-inducible protein DinB
MAGLIPKLIEHLENGHATLQRAVAAIPMEMRSTKPPGGGWSVAQVVQHVAHVNTRFSAMLERGIAAAPDTTQEPDASTVLNSRKVVAVLDRTRRVESQEAFIPTQSWDTDEALQKLDDAHVALLAVVRTAQGKALSGIKYPHYILGELSLFEWIAFAGTHEMRHAAQILEIGEALGCKPS